MNIIVRIPKDQRQHTLDDKLAGDSALAWWTLSSVPRHIHTGAAVIFRAGDHLIAHAPIVYVGDGRGLAELCPEDADTVRDLRAVVAWRPCDAQVYDEPRRCWPTAGQWGWRYDR